MSEKRRNKGGRNPKLDPAVFRYTVRFSEEEHNRFLSMFEKSGVYAKSVFLKAHFFGQPFKVLKVDKTLVDYYTKLSDFHAQFRAIGTNYNQVVKELRLHFSEKKAMALLYKLKQQKSVSVGNFPAVSTLSSFRRETGYTREILLSSLIALKYMPSINK